MRSAKLLFLAFTLCFALFSDPGQCTAQSFTHKFQKNNRKFYKRRFKNTLKAEAQCTRLLKKKYREKNKKVVVRGKKPSSVPLAEYDPNDRPPKPKPAPVAKAETKDLHDKTFEEQTLAERHQIEDEVLAKNQLPTPTSTKHEEIRKQVSEQLKSHKDGEPLKLEPLYFVFDEDEFSVVDMEPFLVAVEYALQGRIILIEGHTDSRGQDEYNVTLSIKRVEKIRQLMHDMGVPDDRISVVGYGEEISTHENSSQEGRQKNRRVDFTVF